MPQRKVIPIGTKFGRLTMLSDLGMRPSKWGNLSFSQCQCDCGEIIEVRNTFLRNGHTQSCGCLMIDRTSEANTTHGQSYKNRTTEWVIYTNIIQRCTNPENPAYPRYGGRGIKVCDSWRTSFSNFFADVGKRPKGLTLDRIDNEGNYEPLNVRWATRKEQANNTRKNVRLTYQEKTYTVAELAEIFKVARTRIDKRLAKNMTGDEIIESIQKRKPYGKHIS